MSFLPHLLCLAALLRSTLANAETYVWFKPWKSSAELVEILKSVPESRELVERSLKKDPKLLEHIHPGVSSFTENVGTRGHAVQRIQIRRGHKLSDAVADLAHELVHFSGKKPSDPYEADFGLKKFVVDSIEGEAGELAAFRQECRLAWELEKSQPAFPRHAFCEKYRKEESGFDAEKAKVAYYAIGKWHRDFYPELKASLPLLGAEPPAFTSGVNGQPYPVSFARDYFSTLKAACEANRARYRALALKAKSVRGGAALALLEEKKKLEKFNESRCR
jgi:hypothetical protein